MSTRTFPSARPQPTDDRRQGVAITGVGVKTALGATKDVLWSGLLAGRSAAGPVTLFDAAELPVRLACEAKDFDASAYASAKEQRRLERSTLLALGAASDAWEDAGPFAPDPSRTAVVVGTGLGGAASTEAQAVTFAERGWPSVSPLWASQAMGGTAAAAVAIRLGVTGPTWVLAAPAPRGCRPSNSGASWWRTAPSTSPSPVAVTAP